MTMPNPLEILEIILIYEKTEFENEWKKFMKNLEYFYFNFKNLFF